MLEKIIQAFTATPHAYQLADGHTLRLTDREQREVERFNRWVEQTKNRILDVMIAAAPGAPAPSAFAGLVVEALISDIGMWFLSVDPTKLVADEALDDLPPVLPDLLDVLSQLKPSEAQRVREGICQSRELWRSLCESSPCTALDPEVTDRSPETLAMRVRFMSWSNAINRALPVPSIRDTRGGSPVPSKLTSRQTALVTDAARELATMHEWRGLGGEIAPHVIVTLPGWPAGRPLQILTLEGDKLDQFGPDLAPGQKPVTLLFDRLEGHYCGQVNGRKVPTPPGGDCFYRAVLTSMTTPERDALLERVGGFPDDAFGDASLARLRTAASRQLTANAQRFAPLLELMQLAEASPGR